MFSKVAKKKSLGKCCICEDKTYSILDCHRIIPGSKYTDWGTIVVCSNCHRKIHDDIIRITGKFRSTTGDVLVYEMVNNEGEWEELIKNC